MIQANDVKLKNNIYRIFKTHRQVVEVCGIVENEINFIPLEDFEGIPLTPEILIACEFNVDQNGYFIDAWTTGQNARFDISWFDGNVFLKSRYEEEKLEVQKLPHIKSLHQLQNLFYTLTGRELNYRP